MVLTPIVLSAAAGGLTWWLTTLLGRGRDAARAKRRAMFADVASQEGIECEWDEATGVFRGTVQGRTIEYGVVLRSGIVRMGHVTMAHVRTPVGMFEMDIRPASPLARILSRRATAVATGDVEFDGAYVVASGPALGGPTFSERAKGLLDRPTRTWLLVEHPARLRVTKDGIVFEKEGRHEDAAAIRSILVGLRHFAVTLVEPHGYRD